MTQDSHPLYIRPASPSSSRSPSTIGRFSRLGRPCPPVESLCRARERTPHRGDVGRRGSSTAARKAYRLNELERFTITLDPRSLRLVRREMLERVPHRATETMLVVESTGRNSRLCCVTCGGAEDFRRRMKISPLMVRTAKRSTERPSIRLLPRERTFLTAGMRPRRTPTTLG